MSSAVQVSGIFPPCKAKGAQFRVPSARAQHMSEAHFGVLDANP